MIVLTYNEVDRLRPCLESISWADEIVIVDGGSSDDTRAIASEFKSHVYVSDLLGPDKPGGFSDQRNFGLSKATGDWVFYLDADERVTPELAEEIKRRILSSSDENHDVYRLRRKEYFFGVYTPFTHGQAWQTRLLRRGCGRWDGRLVHEGLIHTGTLGDLNEYILHFSKDTVAQYVATMNRYTSLEAEELTKNQAPFPDTPWPAMVHAFLYRYIHMRSYREGTFGLLMSLMFAFYQYLTWVKHWEMCKTEGRIYHSQPSTLAAITFSAISRLWHGYGAVKKYARKLPGSRG